MRRKCRKKQFPYCPLEVVYITVTVSLEVSDHIMWKNVCPILWFWQKTLIQGALLYGSRLSVSVFCWFMCRRGTNIRVVDNDMKSWQWHDSFSEWGLVNVEERTTQSLRRKNLTTDQVWLSLTDNRPPVLFVCLYKRRFSFCIWIIQHQLLSLSVCVFNSDKGLYQVICWHNTVTQTTSVVCVCEVITNECEAIKGHHREHTLKHTTAFLKSCDI